MSVTYSGSVLGLVLAVVCVAIVGAVVLFAIAWGASARRVDEIEGGRR